jgi:hypothetical protein
MNRRLRTKDGPLTFRLIHAFGEEEPKIHVYEGTFLHAAYDLSTIDHTDWDEGEPLEGWCVRHTKFEKDLNVSARAHKAIVREAHKLLARRAA